MKTFPSAYVVRLGWGGVLVTSALKAQRSACSFSGICCPQVGKYGNKSIHRGAYHLLTEAAASCELQQVQRWSIVSLKASWKGSQPSSLAAAQPGRIHATCVPSTEKRAPLWAALHAWQEYSCSPGKPGPQECWLQRVMQSQLMNQVTPDTSQIRGLEANISATTWPTQSLGNSPDKPEAQWSFHPTQNWLSSSMYVCIRRSPHI